MNLTQADFGVLAGVTVTAQLNYEKGTRNPDTAYLERLGAHGVDVAYLVTGVPSGPLAADEARLITLYKQADPEARQVLQSVAELAKRAIGPADPGKGGNTVTIGGDVGQSIAGDQTNTGSVSFVMPKKGK